MKLKTTVNKNNKVDISPSHTNISKGINHRTAIMIIILLVAVAIGCTKNDKSDTNENNDDTSE
jgi:hypothetical protein